MKTRYIAQNDRWYDRVVVPHTDVALEGFVRFRQFSRPLVQLGLAERSNGAIAHRCGRNSDFRRNGIPHKGVHGLIPQGGEHVLSLLVIWTDVAVGEGI